MNTHTQDKTVLSGWARLWIVGSLTSWLAGFTDLLLSPEPFQSLIALGDGTLRSVRLLLWFLGPLTVAAVWLAVRWVWLGFHPSAQAGALRHMGPKEMAGRTLRVLKKSTIAVLMLAFAAGWGVWLPIFFITNSDPVPFWLEIYAICHFLAALHIVGEAWKVLTERPDEEAARPAENALRPVRSARQTKSPARRSAASVASRPQDAQPHPHQG